MAETNSKYKIAFASSNGIDINEHFSRANFFYIYEVHGDNWYKSECREINKTQELDRHGELEEIIRQLDDCSVVMAEKIGPYAKRVIERNKVDSYVISTQIRYAIIRLINYNRKFQNKNRSEKNDKKA